MTRYVVISVMGALLAGCAADFDDGGSAAVPNADEATKIRTFGGVLERPGEAVEPVQLASERTDTREIDRYYRTIDGKQIELGGKFERSSE